MADRRLRALSPWRRTGSFSVPLDTTTTLTASAQEIHLGNGRAIETMLAYRQKWQEQAMNNISVIGELMFGISVPASLISRVSLFVAMNSDKADSEPIRVNGEATEGNPVSSGDLTAIATLDALGSVLTRSQLQFDAAFNLLGPGECYLICIGAREGLYDENRLMPDGSPRLVRPATPERWEIRSIREIDRSGDSIRIYDVMIDDFLILDEDMGDTFIRIWRPDPFHHQFATSHVRAVLGAAEELLWADAAAVATLKQRLMMAGLIGIPSNIEGPITADTPSTMSGVQRWITAFLKKTIRPTQNPNDAAAAVPFVYSYPVNDRGDPGIKIDEFARPQDELLEARTERSLKRIEQGINLPVGVISGLGTATHWGGGMVEQSVFRDHVEPLVVMLCEALTRSYLQPALMKAGVADAEKYFIWYDASNLIVHQDKAANIFRAAELGAVGLAAVRREIGVRETDAPSDEELDKLASWFERVRGRGPKEAAVEKEEQADVSDPNAPPKENAPGKDTSEDDKTPTTRGRGRDPVQAAAALTGNGQHSMTAGRIQVLCDEKCRRALEKAGNRLVSRAKKIPTYKEAIRDVPTSQVASTLGREKVVHLGIDDIFDDCFSDLHSRVLALLPTSVFAVDTVRPISALASELRQICSRALFDPPGPEMMVDIGTIERVLGETLHSDQLSA